MNAPTTTTPETPDEADVRLNKDVAAFGYIWAMSLVVLFARRNSSFSQFHSKQGVTLFIMSFVWIIPFIGHFLALFVVAGMVLGFIHASQGKKVDVPFVGPLSRGEVKFGYYGEGLLKAFKAGFAALKQHHERTSPSEENKQTVSSTGPTPVK